MLILRTRWRAALPWRLWWSVVRRSSLVLVIRLTRLFLRGLVSVRLIDESRGSTAVTRLAGVLSVATSHDASDGNYD
ncbi:uncharacterized protein ASPGLDRAFT_1077591 [Aspergillus glaucus CBS 516.65]|uniref:Uncharacterized protein n=1 Tax=Aspergillus glaucus CBS 516.65 TaxID=1160497 RepID=A0A1L9V528_ASPGL|nr:hypothetical protein ASPGLDRAFT_1077591 [Aspergillus glaucus CBS 516.65]OJJ79045.1 hypothetical protein ASPGLDRAFT_1077591 [Aspergillus glaucus CBS 516.65]